MTAPVKGKTEAGRRRERRAHHTRARITEAALRLFLERGYLATTIEAIAGEAGVAPATVYQAFGTKQAVLAQALDTSIAGDDAPLPLLERDWVAAVGRERSPRRRLAAAVQRAAHIAVRTAALKEVIRDAAAVDPRARELIREDHRRRRETQRTLVEIAIGNSELRPGLTFDQGADTFSMLVASNGYELATQSLGWDERDWQEWLVQVLSHELFGDAGGGQ